MKNFNQLKQQITAAIYDNGQGLISGSVLQEKLLAIVSKMEISTFEGIATAATQPTTDKLGEHFYIAKTAGTYSNFDGHQVGANEVVMFCKDTGETTWSHVVLYTPHVAVDTTPTSGSTNAVQSGGVKSYVDGQIAGCATASQVTQLSSKVDELDTASNECKEAVEGLQDELEQLTPTVVQGDVTNNPDNEDLMAVDGVLKLRNRTTIYASKGYVILRRITEGDVLTQLQAQISSANTIYEIRCDFNISNEDNEALTIPSGCELFFNGGDITGGIVECNMTKTNRIASSLRGDFICGNVYHSYKSNISSPIVFDGVDCFWHNQVSVDSYISVKHGSINNLNAKVNCKGLYTKGNAKISIYAEDSDVVGCSFTLADDAECDYNTAYYRYCAVYLAGNSNALNCKFEDFDSDIYGGINCIGTSADAIFKIQGCSFKNITSKSDGVVGEGNLGSARAITVGFSYLNTNIGRSSIEGCKFENIYSWTGTSDSKTEVLDDCDGIYITGTYNNVVYKVRDISIISCEFTNVRKRSIKVQSEGVEIVNCKFTEGDDVGNSFMESTISAMCSSIKIDGCIFQSKRISISKYYRGLLELSNCQIDAASYAILSVEIGDNINITRSSITANYLHYFSASLRDTGTNNIIISDSTVDVNFMGLSTTMIGKNDLLSISNSVINTSKLGASTSFDGNNTLFNNARIDSSVINFDISEVTSTVNLICFNNNLEIKNSVVNITAAHDENDASVISSGSLFKSSYQVEGYIVIDGLTLNISHKTNIQPFNLTIKPIKESYFGHINIDNCIDMSYITVGKSGYKRVVYEDITLPSTGNQVLWLMQVSNILLKNMGNEGDIAARSLIKCGYNKPDVLYEKVFYKTASNSPGNPTQLAHLTGIRTIGDDGFIFNGVDSVQRKYYWLGNTKVALDCTNSSLDGDTPTLKSADAGVTKYSSTHSKMILWNGTAWVNLDGTALA